MNIISQDSSKVTILVPLEEIVPLGGMNGPEAIAAIQQRYEFLKAPDPAMTREEASKTGYKFGTGQMSLKGKKSTIVEFAIYSDGIVADAKTSDVAESFLDDIILFMQSEFEFRKFYTEPKRYFHNQLVVEFERPLKKLVPAFDHITKAIAHKLDPDIPIGFARLDFQVDKTGQSGPAAKFIIERRAGISFDKERYYSSAPLRTADHVAILEEIEAAII